MFATTHFPAKHKQKTGYIFLNNTRFLLYSILHYLLTPWCRVLLEKLTGLQLVKKFHAFYGIRRFITALTSVRHLSLSWANPIKSIYPHPTSWRSILILSTHLRLGLPSGLFPSGFPTKTLQYTCTKHKPKIPLFSLVFIQRSPKTIKTESSYNFKSFPFLIRLVS